jgi:hypothetical protein
MNWFEQLRQALADYYPAAADRTVVGYLQGSASPGVWMQMARTQDRHQMVILGSLPPTAEDWAAAGVRQRGNVQVIRISDLAGWIVLYGGFVRRPWGELHQVDSDALTIGFPGSLQRWRSNAPRRRL